MKGISLSSSHTDSVCAVHLLYSRERKTSLLKTAKRTESRGSF